MPLSVSQSTDSYEDMWITPQSPRPRRLPPFSLNQRQIERHGPDSAHQRERRSCEPVEVVCSLLDSLLALGFKLSLPLSRLIRFAEGGTSDGIERTEAKVCRGLRACLSFQRSRKSTHYAGGRRRRSKTAAFRAIIILEASSRIAQTGDRRYHIGPWSSPVLPSEAFKSATASMFSTHQYASSILRQPSSPLFMSFPLIKFADGSLF